MASVFVLLEAFNRKEAAALGFFPCATASFVMAYTGRWGTPPPTTVVRVLAPLEGSEGWP